MKMGRGMQDIHKRNSSNSPENGLMIDSQLQDITIKTDKGGHFKHPSVSNSSGHRMIGEFKFGERG